MERRVTRYFSPAAPRVTKAPLVSLRQAKSLERYENHVILTVGLMLAVLLRFSLRSFESGDYHAFLKSWYDMLAQQGFSAFETGFSNYTPLYLYLLALVAMLFPTLPSLFVIKLVSALFDPLAGFFVYKIVRLKYPAGVIPIFAFFATLFAPTVFLNSSFWGQADAVYTTGLLACLYFLATKREIPALIAFGLAFAFKLQAVFLLPFLLALFLQGNISWKSFGLVPLIYLITILPAWLAGRPLVDLLLIYPAQVDFYHALTFNAPNLYQWLPEEYYDIFYPAGLIWTGAIAFMLAVGVYKSRVKLRVETMLQLALLSVLIMPYFLPKMHDRYFFPADVIAIIFAFYFPQYFFVPIIIGVVSLFSYWPFLFGHQVIPLSTLAFVLAGMIILLLRHFILTLQSSQPD